MSDPQDDLIEAVNAALTQHAEMHGAWVLAYEEQRPSEDGVPITRASLVGDGSPLAQLGVATVGRHWTLRNLTEEGDW